MANGMIWLVTLDRPAEPDGGPFGFEALDDAIDHMRDHRREVPILWARSDICLIGPSAEPDPAPKKKRAQRRRKDSPAQEPTPQTTPAADDAPKAGDVRPTSPSCGGTRCRDKGGIEVHDANDPACTKMHNRKAVRG
jgi:hypothetical protein